MAGMSRATIPAVRATRMTKAAPPTATAAGASTRGRNFTKLGGGTSAAASAGIKFRLARTATENENFVRSSELRNYTLIVLLSYRINLILK